jgi:hypothetical protein
MGSYRSVFGKTIIVENAFMPNVKNVLRKAEQCRPCEKQRLTFFFSKDRI